MNYLNPLSKVTGKILAALVLCCALFIASCDDEEKIVPVVVEFANGNTTINEDAGPKVITLSLDRAAFTDGTVAIAATPASAADFISVPTEVEIGNGNTSAQFTVTPTNNQTIDGAQEITLTISSPSNGFSLGTETSIVVTILDDEGPVEAVFTNEEGTVSEGSAEGISVAMMFSEAVDVGGDLTITYAPAEATITTVPAATSASITVPVQAGATEAFFTVTPTNNDLDDDDYTVVFTISGATGGLNVGTVNTTFALTVTDDDNKQIVTIAEVRAMYEGSNVNITEDIYVQGIVTSSNANGNLNANNAFVQDATAGIVLRFANANTFARGEEILVNLNGGRLTEFNGLRQVDQLPNGNGTKIGDATLPAPASISIEQLNSGDFEGKLVSIADVYFRDADGFISMAGNKVLSDGTLTTTVRTENNAVFKDEIVPLGSGTVVGVAGDFNGAQLIPQDFATDIFENAPLGTMNVSLIELPNFGSVNSNEVSASTSYTIQGSGFVEDLIVTAPANFKLSKSADGTYEESLTFTAQEANAGVLTVHVKFAPTSGQAGIKVGQVINKSRGFVSRKIGVAGEEISAAPARTTIAHWTFETSLPTGTNVAVSSDYAAENGTQAGTAMARGVHASADTDYSNPVGNGSNESFSSNTWAVDDYYQFTVSTTGFSNIAVSWDQTGSSTGPGDFALYYSSNGTDFTKYEDYVLVKSTGTNITYTDGTTGGSWVGTMLATNTSYSFDLSSITALSDNGTVVFRLVCMAAPSSTGGTNRVDNFKVEGE